MSAVTSAFAKLNPFDKKKHSHHKIDDEDVGERVDQGTVAGGGHASRQSAVTSHLRVSHALRSFIVANHILSEEEAGLDNLDETTHALKSLLNKPHIEVPRELTDRSHPLPDYFISSSHNTYLLAHQLYGSASATAYETALKAGARCVEIDAWDSDNKEEPKVTHGYTLTSHIPFRQVCETIRDVIDQEAKEAIDEQGYRAAPILISLENHCDAHGQTRLAAILREVFGDRLLTKAIREKGTHDQEAPITVIVEYHFPDEPDSSDESDTSESEDETEKKARHDYKAQKRETKEAVPAVIVPELAELGVYAQSCKPPNNAWFEKGVLEHSPHHPLINVSETGLASHMPAHNTLIARHNANHLMRVYPKGTRISSRNLKPVPFWAVGAQICAMNWQTFGASMQLNEALFAGTEGFVLKPRFLRLDQSGSGELYHTPTKSRHKMKLRLHIAGATDIPVPQDKAADMKPYLTCTLVHATSGDEPAKRKTAAYKQHKVTGFLHKGENPPVTEPVWDEILEWDLPTDNGDPDHELVFLRMLIKSDDSFARNPIYAVSCVRLCTVRQADWVFVRMLDLKGQETGCAVLVRLDVVSLGHLD
ncbi:1-phosphatidylinositol 4,5-bisphosphate phosphodiesterase delta-1 [Cyphellophora attinorum]|uniref:Phosphoinositide phospholipase C n=1 Tax=Cyphellophora attinorum TaxID=1664694 RepID=A0A0N1HB31_9EURO|nr:1-phosphatidylinositol 4,5-bisphosphate phosphodiesterase delta-1 [Phialophora attinorum]KPI45322.1 1-phosphatidylinositol 4,5-bisphosphate phosphodiesterase delta-1 [Phialophora attinorum]